MSLILWRESARKAKIGKLIAGDLSHTRFLQWELTAKVQFSYFLVIQQVVAFAGILILSHGQYVSPI